jgi:AcrR family transcriptional regulator
MVKNVDRSAATRGRLVSVARALFAADGYAATGTEAILDGAGVKRGALYHHFRDKADLFEAVCRQLAEEAVVAIREAAARETTPFDALVAGSLGWFDAMLRPDVRRILIIEAPGVLGWERWNALDAQHGFGLLRQGVAAALAEGAIRFDGDADTLALLLNGAMNGAVVHAGAADKDETAAIRQGIVALIAAFRAPPG